MKKLILMILAIFGLMACSSDDDSTWEPTKETKLLPSSITHISYSEGIPKGYGYVDEFAYDDKNRMINIKKYNDVYKITYDGNKVVKVEFIRSLPYAEEVIDTYNFTYTGNNINVEEFDSFHHITEHYSLTIENDVLKNTHTELYYTEIEKGEEIEVTLLKDINYTYDNGGNLISQITVKANSVDDIIYNKSSYNYKTYDYDLTNKNIFRFTNTPSWLLTFLELEDLTGTNLLKKIFRDSLSVNSTYTRIFTWSEFENEYPYNYTVLFDNAIPPTEDHSEIIYQEAN